MSVPAISIEAVLSELRTLGGEAALLDETRCRAILADRLPEERARASAALTALRAGVVDRLRATAPEMAHEAVLREAGLLTQDYALTQALAMEAVQAWARVFGLEAGAATKAPGPPGRDWAKILKQWIPAGLSLPPALKARNAQMGLAALVVIGLAWSQLAPAGNLYNAYGISKQEDLDLLAKQLIETAVQRKGVDFVAAKANSGNPAGQALYCFANYFGISTPENNDLAREWCEKAAKGKNPLGHFGLFLLYQYGYGVPIDKISAKGHLLAAAEGGDARAGYWAANVYLVGDELTPIDDQAALKITKTLAKNGQKNSRFRLGWMHENGRGLPQNREEALRIYQQLAQEGLPAGIRGHAWMIYNGWGGAVQDYAEAARLYRQASDLGDGNASSNLAGMYRSGEGVEQDIGEAVRLYRLAISQGYDSAASSLRAMGYEP